MSGHKAKAEVRGVHVLGVSAVKLRVEGNYVDVDHLVRFYFSPAVDRGLKVEKPILGQS